MEMVRNKNMKLSIVVTLILSLFVFSFGPTALAHDEFERKGTIIAESVYYNTETKKYEFDSEYALSNGLTNEEVNNAKFFFESLTVSDVEEMNNEIGFDVSEEIAEVNNSEVTTYFIPAILIPIAKFLVGSAGAVIVYHVVTYGIIKACQNLKGDYWFFTDFCETNGWI